jgi:hypothetical protein
MKRVRREELLDLAAYERSRAEIRAAILEAKRVRRVHVAGVLTFLFENTATIRYQIQEMMRAERMAREADIQHELETYNELLGGPGELGCSLLIELPDPKDRDEKLRAWRDLPRHVYVTLDDGTKARATFDPRQVGDDRLSSVQYLKFGVGAGAPVAVGSDHPQLEGETALDAEQRAALAADLASDRGK